MAEKLDVASRLAEGLPSVDTIQNYVWACHALGYQHPDLTLHAAQVHDWYASEDGLDLRALDADCAALQAVVAATEDALMRQDEQLATMSATWQGRGADASREFLRRHGDASAVAAAAVRTAADALADLRDNLWHSVDGKVAAALSVDERAQARRADWLAAAHTVTTGAGDRAVASELIDQEVKPFVDNAIRADWVTAMRAAMAAVADAYHAATAELTSGVDAVFDVPGDLGPSWTPTPRDEDVSTTPAAAVSSSAPAVASPPAWSTTPAAPAPWAPPAAPPPAAPPPLPVPPAAPPVEPAAAAPAMAAPPTPSLGGMGGGMPDIGSGLSGLGQQLGETLGGLFGSADDALADPPELDDPEELDDPDDETEDPLDDENSEEPAQDADAEVDTAEEAVDPAVETGDACGEETDAVPAAAPPPAEPPLPSEPAPTPAPLPPPPPEAAPPTPPPPANPAADNETPCEIAADELPQVGE